LLNARNPTCYTWLVNYIFQEVTMSNIMHANFRRQHTNAKSPAPATVDRGMRLPTTEMKLHIRMLETVLAIPCDHEHGVKSERVRTAMSERLTQYRRELALRDALRDQGQPATERALSQGVAVLQRKHARAA
jgi:hypothetical protein